MNSLLSHKKRIKLRFNGKSFYNVIFEFSKEYQALKAKVIKLNANKAFTEKQQQYEKRYFSDTINLYFI